MDFLDWYQRFWLQVKKRPAFMTVQSNHAAANPAIASGVVEHGAVACVAHAVKSRTLDFLRFSSLLALLAVAGCTDESGTHTFIPAPEYSCVVTLSVPKEGVVGEWIPLKVSLTNGPWMRVRRRDVADGAVAWPERPPPFEREMAAGLMWFTDPPDVARFNVPTMQSVQSEPYGRQAMFSQPG